MFDYFSRPLKAGSQAPDFNLADNEGGHVSLSALRGKYVVLIFYPCDNSHTCIKQMCEFRDRWGFMMNHGVEVLGVNPAGPQSHEDFRDNYCLPFRLLVDPKQKIASAYKAKGFMVRRTVYLIGPDGKVLLSRRGMPSPIELLELIPGALEQQPGLRAATPA
jgi:thioredoxin-dependent peroxiredoxin